MKFKDSSLRCLAAIFAAVFVFSAAPVFAQDGEPVVIDEVIAQVNDGVITLSRVKREGKAAADALVQGGKKPDEAQREIDARRPELIASLINEELLMQQGKEMGLESEVEAEVNQRFSAILKEQGLKSLAELDTQMRANNVDPDEIKASMRKEFMKQFVIRYGVGSKIYNGLTDKEVKAYFESHKDKFKTPETVALSEIFLNYAGKTEDAQKTLAAEIVKKVRAGADFKTLVAQYSDRADSKAKQGSVGKFTIDTLNEEIVGAVKNVKAGGVSEPLLQEGGVLILHVDERIGDSATPTFDDRRAREMITNERMEAGQKKFMDGLRQEAFIKISDTYKDAVSQVLNKKAASN